MAAQPIAQGAAAQSLAPRRAWLLSLVAIAGCATFLASDLDQRYGAADPARFDRPASAGVGENSRVREILDQRCTVCHGCNDAPCQLTPASQEGLPRGASREQVYATRLAPTAPTRLFVDAQTNADWRRKGFHAVLNERSATPEAERDAGVLYRLLKLKQEYPVPVRERLD